MGVNNCIDCDNKKAEVDCNCIQVENADGTLQDIVLGCTDPLAINYNALANCDDGSCIDLVAGCMDPTSLNYSACYNADCAGVVGGSDTSCCCSVAGCMDSGASNYNASACLDDGSCIYPGCIDNLACNYNSQATVSDGSCTYPPTASVSQTSCNSYTWTLPGITYTTGGTYSYTNNDPCPTTTTLNLTINNDSSNSDTQTACGTYTWGINGTTYTASGTYTDTSTNAAGCVHTETLNLTIQSLGCTNPSSLNYDPTAQCDDGSCINCQNGCTYGGSLPTWSAIIGDGGPNSSSTWAALYPSEPTPSQAASNYNGSATCEDGSCTFDISGCTDSAACNYDPLATLDDGSCIAPPSLDLGSTSNGINTPNGIHTDGSSGIGYSANLHMCGHAYNGDTTEPIYGAHNTKDSNPTGVTGTFTNHDGSNTWTESYYFELGNGTIADGNPPLVINQIYCISWGEIVLALKQSFCSDCLMGGWDVRIDNTMGSPNTADVNAATSLYDPIAGTVSHGTYPGGLSHATGMNNGVNGGVNGDGNNFHDAECSGTANTNASGNSYGINTAGASNGSGSEWNSKCITFVASATEHRVHMIVVTEYGTGPNQCNECHDAPLSSTHGVYMGISKVQIGTSCTGDCSC